MNQLQKKFLDPTLAVTILFFSVLAVSCLIAKEKDIAPSIEETTPPNQKEAQPGSILPVSNKPTIAPAPAEKKVISTNEEEGKPQQVGLPVRKIEIRFSGPKTANENFVLAHMRTKVGEPFAQADSDSDVRSLYATDQFSNVRIKQEPMGDGIKVVVILQGKTKLKEVLFEGNKRFSSDRLLKEAKVPDGLPGKDGKVKTVALKTGNVFSEKQVSQAAYSLVEFYQKHGFHAVKVGFEVTPDELTGLSVVKYMITEGGRIKIDHVDFVGNKTFSSKVLRKKVETRNHNWLSWFSKKGFIKDTVIEEDKQKVADFYRSEGYIDAEVKDVKTDYPTKETAVITFFIYEGNQYKVGKFNVEGNQLFTRAEIDKKILMKEGSLFTPGGLEKDIKAVRDLYGARGYIDTVVRPTKVPNTQTGNMDVNLEIREGDLAYVDLIEIRGNIKTKDKVLRRELAVAPGEIYNSVKVEASKKRLENLGYFSKVTTEPENTDVPNRKNLLISVEEQRTGSISFGAGFSSVDSILGFVELTQGNFDISKPPYFTGAGQKARIRAQFGARRQDYIISFTEPWFMNRKLSLGFDLFFDQAEYLSAVYNERNYGFDVKLGKELGEFNSANIQYRLEEIQLFNVAAGAPPSIRAEAGNRSKSSVLLTLTRDTRDELMLPGKGYKVDVWSEVAGGPALQGQTSTYKFGLEGQIFFTMPWWEKNILSFNGATGVVNKWDKGTRVPLLEKFFLGGAGTVRGFKYRNVGPMDQGEPTGGSTMAYLQTEYSIPVIDHVRFATFMDAGGAASESFNWGFPINAGAGIGLRLNLPIGSINLDYAWPIRRDPSTPANGQFTFGGGTRF